MDLATHIRKERTTNAAFAKQAGLSKSFIGRLVAGKCQPGWDAMERIRVASGGKVTERDWAKKFRDRQQLEPPEQSA